MGFQSYRWRDAWHYDWGSFMTDPVKEFMLSKNFYWRDHGYRGPGYWVNDSNPEFYEFHVEAYQAAWMLRLVLEARRDELEGLLDSNYQEGDWDGKRQMVHERIAEINRQLEELK